MDGKQERPRKLMLRAHRDCLGVKRENHTRGLVRMDSPRAHSMVEETEFHEHSRDVTIQRQGQKARDRSIRAGNVK